MKHPMLRGQLAAPLEEGRVQIRDSADIGIAVAASEGLLVPVIAGVEGLPLLEIAKVRRQAVEAAASGRLPAKFAVPGCFTISNLGPYGVDAFHALVNPGEAAILALGAVRRLAVEHEGAIALRRRVALTFTFDHRLVDGAEGARFAGDIVDMFEGRDWTLV